MRRSPPRRLPMAHAPCRAPGRPPVTTGMRARSTPCDEADKPAHKAVPADAGLLHPRLRPARLGPDIGSLGRGHDLARRSRRDGAIRRKRADRAGRAPSPPSPRARLIVTKPSMTALPPGSAGRFTPSLARGHHHEPHHLDHARGRSGRHALAGRRRDRPAAVTAPMPATARPRRARPTRLRRRPTRPPTRKMHKDMDIAFTGDADADFVRSMIPHHQGAIDMARVVLASTARTRRSSKLATERDRRPGEGDRHDARLAEEKRQIIHSHAAGGGNAACPCANPLAHRRRFAGRPRDGAGPACVASSTPPRSPRVS